jgi:ppGpp synthetase/RelA/SpoT-type nucleotidyltranferase
MNSLEEIDVTKQLVGEFHAKRYEFEIFSSGVRDFFLKNPSLQEVVHSVKSRLKDPLHLKKKIERKTEENSPITTANIFQRVTDLAGVRVLHLYQDQFPQIHEAIMQRVGAKDWVLFENPVAYTWDPESETFFKKLELRVERKESFYTSIHYVVKPREDSFITCEIQVRTLFEEIWGEIDHKINYPEKCEIASCREQILVLSKLVGAGSRLADSIFRSHNVD